MSSEGPRGPCQPRVRRGRPSTEGRGPGTGRRTGGLWRRARRAGQGVASGSGPAPPRPDPGPRRPRPFLRRPRPHGTESRLSCGACPCRVRRALGATRRHPDAKRWTDARAVYEGALSERVDADSAGPAGVEGGGRARELDATGLLAKV